MTHNPLFSQAIINLVPSQAKVLDLGCGDGELLTHLQAHKAIIPYGIELDSENVGICIANGINVYQTPIESALRRFSDHSFDVVILSQTLQEIHDPLWVIEQALRVGRTAIVSFPNFAHWRVRLQLALGNIPKTDSLPYSWFDTPNIRVISVKDFESICQVRHIQIDHSFSYDRNHKLVEQSPSNFWSEGAIYILKRRE